MTKDGVIIIGFVLSLIIFYGTAALYFWKGLFHRWYHDVLEWHQPDTHPHTFDGCSKHATCKWCGKDIMQDSQGNWF